MSITLHITADTPDELKEHLLGLSQVAGTERQADGLSAADLSDQELLDLLNARFASQNLVVVVQPIDSRKTTKASAKKTEPSPSQAAAPEPEPSPSQDEAPEPEPTSELTVEGIVSRLLAVWENKPGGEDMVTKMLAELGAQDGKNYGKFSDIPQTPENLARVDAALKIMEAA